MAASEHIHGMYDFAFKPRLLRSLLKEYVPDEKHPLRNPSDLSHVVSAVKCHQLLSECFPPSADQKLIESWKSAVDAWVSRTVALASSNTADKSWVGICLLGLTCQECSSERFLASYTVWFNKIFSHIQPSSDSHFVRIASCASLSDLVTRLGGFPSAKKDGTSYATKLVQHVLKMLSEDGSDTVWEEALCLFCVIINVFPSSIGRHYDNVEATIVSKIISENVNASLLKKLSHALALLPKSRSDEDSWSLMIQKVLLFLNNQLNDLFQGLEEETRRDEVRKLLLPPGKDPPPPLGGPTASGKLSDLAIKRPEQFLVSRISTLMICCCKMLNNSYPVQVPVPVRPLVALARRVLKVDGSLSRAYPFMAAMRQEFVCSDLPVLHRHGLELLSAIVKGLRSHLLPHVADITRLLMEYFKTCALPDLRVMVYSIVKVLLMSMGVGIAIYLIQEIINNAFVDLDTNDQQRRGADSAAYSKTSEEAIQLSFRRKRKHPTTTASPGVLSDQQCIETDRSQAFTPVSVRIAALEALEALLTVGGSMRSDGWRSSVDHLIMTVATNACKGGWAREKSTSFCADATPIWADFQLAALHALLASLLCPGRVRPPHLAQSLDLFRRGARETGTKIAEFCLHALLTLEVLIHPRALPIIDFQSPAGHYDDVGIKIPETSYSSDHRQSTLFPVGTDEKKDHREAESNEDELYRSWLGSDDIMEDPVSNVENNARNDEEAPEICKHPSLEKVTNDLPSGTSNHEVNKLESSAVGAAAMQIDGDEMMMEIQKQERVVLSEEHDISKGGNSVSITSTRATTGSDQVDSGGGAGSGTLERMDSAPASAKDVFVAEKETTSAVDKITAPTSGKDVITSEKNEYITILENISVSVSNKDSKKTFEHETDDVESLPDIVDGDPDSD